MCGGRGRVGAAPVQCTALCPAADGHDSCESARLAEKVVSRDGHVIRRPSMRSTHALGLEVVHM